jgi:hypothetical protein
MQTVSSSRKVLVRLLQVWLLVKLELHRSSQSPLPRQHLAVAVAQ